jgi:hypothetical protein
MATVAAPTPHPIYLAGRWVESDQVLDVVNPGVKDSGLGREGLRWSIEDMTELRLMVMAQPQ